MEFRIALLAAKLGVGHEIMRMKINQIIFTFLSLLLLFVTEGYSRDRGYLVSISDCNETDSSNYEECIVCNYADKTLHIKHLNAKYNCCFDDIVTRVFIINDKIKINSYEKHGGQCLCNCTYDVEFEIPKLEPGKYILVIKNSMSADKEVKEINIDLTTKSEFEHCLNRQQ